MKHPWICNNSSDSHLHSAHEKIKSKYEGKQLILVIIPNIHLICIQYAQKEKLSVDQYTNHKELWDSFFGPEVVYNPVIKMIQILAQVWLITYQKYNIKTEIILIILFMYSKLN